MKFKKTIVRKVPDKKGGGRQPPNMTVSLCLPTKSAKQLPSEFALMEAWCNANCLGNVSMPTAKKGQIFWFELKQDAVAFKLRWF